MKQFLLFVIFLAAAFCTAVVLMILFAGGLGELLRWTGEADSLLVTAVLALGFSAAAFFFGIFTGDYSWVDRLWSTLPVAFVWYYAARGGFSLSLLITALLVTVWGCRLTWNFAMKGGYTGTEDYRWSILRGRITNPILWQLFSLLFISLFQIGLFVLFTYPVRYIASFPHEGMPYLFIPAAMLGAICIAIETIADNQQWRFQQAKHGPGDRAPARYREDIRRGFLTQGLFGVCRHPNYFGELGFWWSVWLMALSFGGGPMASGLFGPLALTVLFIGSTIFTESLSAAKYPAYREYRKKVSPIIPWFPGRD
ncbi:MAG: DUF1295 domain-containing protein [Spirochaetaceae bacterium]|jgi:steroid 5-alpha reductase family enzyme|nr:DUF1295 domain-containing protein [Spirochaetaceae bacterium]